MPRGEHGEIDMSVVHVVARRWQSGWAFHLGPEDVTQGATLGDVARQVFDYLETRLPGLDHSATSLSVTFDLGTVTEAVDTAKKAIEKAEHAHLVADTRLRTAVATMHRERYASRDIALLLEIDSARVEELLRSTDSR